MPERPGERAQPRAASSHRVGPDARVPGAAGGAGADRRHRKRRRASRWGRHPRRSRRRPAAASATGGGRAGGGGRRHAVRESARGRPRRSRGRGHSGRTGWCPRRRSSAGARRSGTRCRWRTRPRRADAARPRGAGSRSGSAGSPRARPAYRAGRSDGCGPRPPARTRRPRPASSPARWRRAAKRPLTEPAPLCWRRAPHPPRRPARAEAPEERGREARELEEMLLDLEVALVEEEDTARAVAVTPGAPGLLQVALERGRRLVVDDVADVRLVDAETEGAGRHHDDPLALLHEARLVLGALLVGHLAMVAGTWDLDQAEP